MRQHQLRAGDGAQPVEYLAFMHEFLDSVSDPVMLRFFPFWLFETVSLCSPGCFGTHHVDQAGLELTEIDLPLPPKCWD